MNKCTSSPLKHVWIFLLLAVAIGATESLLASQRIVTFQKGKDEATQPFFAAKKPLDCESFAALIDNAVIEAYGLQGTYLIVLVRVGDEETVGNLGRLRVAKVQSYFDQHYKNNAQHLVAEGRRAKGSGRVEVYVGGKLRTLIPIVRNSKRVCSGQVNPFL